MSDLRKHRTDRHMTLRDVSRVVGIDMGHLSRIERGSGLSIDVARKLAGLYQITVDDVTGGAIPPDPRHYRRRGSNKK